MSNPFAILILAAGSSSRMKGEIKQVLPWKKTTLIGHAIKQATKITSHVFVVLGSNANVIQQEIPSEVQTVFNPNWKNGMGSSIAIGVEHILTSKQSIRGLLIMLSDQPLLDAAYLNEMVDFFKTEKYTIVATSYGEKLGVPAIFQNSVLNELTELRKDFGAKQIIKKYSAAVKSVDPKGREIDIDTLDTYHKMVQ
ncbi:MULTISPECIES: nucleotidyltransferase family protein [Flavobacteriaceae]|uniref:nucleotidyltransferase family protein n=1 Tax=Flavobacteriaceae TaxID=49546 RepID=UPI00149297D4|nr:MULTISPECIES: nucleotidyltransferase family protein [Allomuricauda]MDC6364672.1 nucleotidyltransferase family protein [Muricauda sp. AC10]